MSACSRHSITFISFKGGNGERRETSTCERLQVNERLARE